jgi:hypothetical protein
MTLSNVDTLCCDTAQIHAWQSDAAYDYQRELVNWHPSLWDWVIMYLNGLLSSIFGSETANAITRPVLIGLGVALLLFVVWFVYRTRPELFMRNKRSAIATVNEENIYGIDFESVIREALADSDYRQAVRYVYLQTLRYLSDHTLINWMPQKTPTQYVGEYSSDEFRQLTRHFLRIRYGNFQATSATYDEVCRLQSSIIPKEEASV